MAQERKRSILTDPLKVEIAPRAISSAGKIESGRVDELQPAFPPQKRLISFGREKAEGLGYGRSSRKGAPVAEKEIPFFTARPGAPKRSDSPEWMFESSQVTMEDGEDPRTNSGDRTRRPAPGSGMKEGPSTGHGSSNESVQSRFGGIFSRGNRAVSHELSNKVRPLRIPNLTYSAYGKQSWSLDLFFFLHNGIRCEMRDLYRMLYSMYKKSSKLRAKDLRNFFMWWSDFTEFCILTLDIEKKVVFKWLQAFTVLEGLLRPPSRSQMMDKVIFGLRKVEQLKSAVSARRADSLSSMFTVVDDVCHELLQFCNTIESEIKSYGLEDFMLDPGKDLAEMRMRDAMLKAPNPQLTFPMALRWMRGSKVYDEWVSKYMSGSAKFFLSMWSKTYDRSHVRLVVELTR